MSGLVPRIRRATTADTDRLLDLQADFYREDGYPHRDEPARTAWNHLLADTAVGGTWVAQLGPDVLGYVVVTFVHSLEHFGRDAVVDELYVTPTSRGRSLGSRLLDAAEAACREAQVAVLHLEVEPHKERVVAMYRRHGFIAERRVFMSKDLRCG